MIAACLPACMPACMHACTRARHVDACVINAAAVELPRYSECIEIISGAFFLSGTASDPCLPADWRPQRHVQQRTVAARIASRPTATQAMMPAHAAARASWRCAQASCPAISHRPGFCCESRQIFAFLASTSTQHLNSRTPDPTFLHAANDRKNAAVLVQLACRHPARCGTHDMRCQGSRDWSRSRGPAGAGGLPAARRHPRVRAAGAAR